MVKNNLFPTIQTQRLILRSLTIEDAPEVQKLAGDRDIAATTLSIPHPYENGMAEAWIETHPEAYEKGVGITWAITLRDNGIFCGTIGLLINQEHNKAELGYWVGKPYWGKGYCTEAANAIVQYGFETLGLHRIHAAHFARNLASGRVMQKIGMRLEGCKRQHILKWGKFEDLVLYGILKSDLKR